MGKISEVRYTLPNVDVIHQVDFKRAPGDPNDDPETNIHKYGCRYMCMLTMCQYFAGRALSRNQILTIYHKAINGELGNPFDFKNFLYLFFFCYVLQIAILS